MEEESQYVTNNSEIISLEFLLKLQNSTDDVPRYTFSNQSPKVIALIMCVIATILNSGSLLAISQLQRSLTPNLRLIISLSLSDMLLCLSLVLQMEVTNPLVRFTCSEKIIHSVVMMSQILSVLNLLGLALDHYMALVKPLSYPIVMRCGRTNAMIATFWFFSALSGFSDLLIPALLYGSPSRLNNTGRFSMCHFPLPSRISDYIMYSLTVIIFIMMTILYLNVYAKIFKHHRFRLAQNPLIKRNMRGVITTLIIMGTFVVCWLPVCILEIAIMIQTETNVGKVLSNFNVILTTYFYLFDLVILNSVCDPIIYAVRMREVQRGYRRLVHQILCIKKKAQSKKPCRASVASSSSSTTNRSTTHRLSRQKTVSQSEDTTRTDV